MMILCSRRASRDKHWISPKYCVLFERPLVEPEWKREYLLTGCAIPLPLHLTDFATARIATLADRASLHIITLPIFQSFSTHKPC